MSWCRSSADTDFDTVRQFARDVAEVVAADDPAHRTVEQRKDKRGDRMYLDVMRNAYAQTAVAPYAVRARRGAPVATPLEWDELERPRPAGRSIHDPRRTEADRRAAAIHGPTCSAAARSLARPTQRLAKLVPELPDVEGLRRELGPYAARAAGSAGSTCATPACCATRRRERLARNLVGRRFAEPRRHGKWLILPTDGPTLLVHSGMTGHPVLRRR